MRPTALDVSTGTNRDVEDHVRISYQELVLGHDKAFETEEEAAQHDEQLFLATVRKMAVKRI